MAFICEYNEQATADRRKGVIVQLSDWAMR
jgi:hypothetical protein